MCCSGGYQERPRPYKPENHIGCNCGGRNNDCNGPSNALEGSVLYNFEQIHGKVIVEVSYDLDENGRFVQTYKKTLCSLGNKNLKRKGCCSVRYRV